MLLTPFEQIEIYIVSYPIDVLYITVRDCAAACGARFQRAV